MEIKEDATTSHEEDCEIYSGGDCGCGHPDHPHHPGHGGGDCGGSPGHGKCGRPCRCSKCCPCHCENDIVAETLPRLSLKDISPRLPNHLTDEYQQEIFLKQYPPKGCGPQIVDFAPKAACVGSLMVIVGHGFAPRRELNTVTVGGRKAMVVTAERHRLVVITDFKTRTGPVFVRTDCGQSKGPRNFVRVSFPAPPPGPEINGAPISFAGAGIGVWGNSQLRQDINTKLLTTTADAQPGNGVQALAVPTTGEAKVIVVCCYPSDNVPPNLATERTKVVNNCDSMRTYYRQASYNSLTVNSTVTNYTALTDKLDHYYNPSTTDKGYPNFYKSVLTQLYAEASQQAIDAGHDLNDYHVLLVMVYINAKVRAWGGRQIGPNIKFDRAADPDNGVAAISINITLNHSLGSIALGDLADWGRYVHEFGHNIVPSGSTLGEDIYSSDTDPGADFSASSFDMMGKHDTHPLFSGWNMDGLGWFKEANILSLTWKREARSEEVEIVEHGLSQNTNANRYHLVRIEVSAGLFYYVEVRRKPAATSTQVFDTNIPVPTGGDGGVLVTRAISGTVNNNQEIRLVTLLQTSKVPLTTGEVAVDPLRTILITVVDDNVQASPRVCKVRIEWGQPTQPTPGGTFDLWLTPWGAGYTTPDIWIDRDPFGTYDRMDGSGNPINGGDAPRIGEINRYTTRIRNSGSQAATDVLTTFYVNTPPGIGDNGNWTPLTTKTIANIPAGGDSVIHANWAPNVDEHTCLKIAISPQTGEVDLGNNHAQENVFTFLPKSHSVPEPVEMPVSVRNPLNTRSIVWLSVEGVPEGFYVYFPHDYVYLDPLGELKLELLVIPLREIRDLKTKIANVKVSGYVPWEYEEKQSNGENVASLQRLIGGIQAIVAPKIGSSITLQNSPTRERDYVVVRGGVTPPTAMQAVRVDMSTDDGAVYRSSVQTDRRGAFAAAFQIPGTGGGVGLQALREVNLTFQAHIINATVLAPADSNVVYYSTMVDDGQPSGPK